MPAVLVASSRSAIRLPPSVLPAVRKLNQVKNINVHVFVARWYAGQAVHSRNRAMISDITAALFLYAALPAARRFT